MIMFTRFTRIPSIGPTRRLLAAAGLVSMLAGGGIGVMAAEGEAARPLRIHIAPGMGADEAEDTLRPALRYYAFWSTGDERLARETLSPGFVDLNLPEGRPQGQEGPVLASRTFRQAIPDLKAVAEEVWVMGDTMIGRLRFTGHFTGTFGGVRGQGQPVSFVAVDIYRVRGGRIASNWHLEDNLTLMRQLGLSPSQP